MRFLLRRLVIAKPCGGCVNPFRKRSARIANDISVPLSRIPEFIRTADAAVRAALPEARSFTFGHVGDGNLHFAVQAPGHASALQATRGAIERVIQDTTNAFNGSMSAEHGLGVAKNEANARYRSADEIALMQAL